MTLKNYLQSFDPPEFSYRELEDELTEGMTPGERFRFMFFTKPVPSDERMKYPLQLNPIRKMERKK